ncbi:conserved hypothetical cytosolic protein [Anaeromyxobacter dehalogenans 2CP-1]|uniref:Conserved hypothetical cytosolic protein n=1 Tax=Anaeromyxobacter dehalogenans (strain ATCC BAA-258 / DSM 21875 / 2CP-1) TaxID=455488 RepID=B8J500_ANAD2|nr:hypothetical protein [Anaeromyxobacter dehalogenans]ACL64855.1 conserved hypothetical cytosolic protein [Anaeromyxobacter dehalogenans 2CP-1]
MSYDADLEAAHRRCGNHRAELLASDVCGCFYCLETFPPAKIEEWIAEDAAGVGKTALCPRCGIDSVIGSKSGLPTDREFLSRMHAYWFGRTYSGAEAEAELARRRRLDE